LASNCWSYLKLLGKPSAQPADFFPPGPDIGSGELRSDQPAFYEPECGRMSKRNVAAYTKKQGTSSIARGDEASYSAKSAGPQLIPANALHDTDSDSRRATPRPMEGLRGSKKHKRLGQHGSSNGSKPARDL